ncbi:membrane dipeptidase-domain-containing protein [Hysterangium stoloniferum]|nr:membrane dipeptidase-domain-containing protein [Hysterangium stoloniferum]
MSLPSPVGDRTPLLQNGATSQDEVHDSQKSLKARGIANGIVSVLFITMIVLSFTLWKESLPTDPHRAALIILTKAPIIDGHIDLPELVRTVYRDNATAVELDKTTPGHVDIPRLLEGKVGGFFWEVLPNFSIGRNNINIFLQLGRFIDTLEQIDVATALINKYGNVFQSAPDANTLRNAIGDGKIASMLGVEGAHQLENSLASLRAYYALGVRYMTLTHSCHNAFADSAGILDPIKPFHNGLSPFGRTLIREMNRIGMIVDLSHTSDATAIQALALTEAPVMWSHSSARAVWNVPRNVPDDILRRIGSETGKRDGVVMVNFAPQFVAADGNATVFAVADHVDHIGNVAGRQYVGIGSDYDGIGSTPVGLEDVSKYPNLFAELLSRGWSRSELEGLAGGNFIRIWEGVEAVSRRMLEEGAQPAYDVYEKRTDLGGS